MEKFFKDNLKVIGVVIVISILVLLGFTIGAYFYNFSSEFSTKNSDWGSFGSFIGGVLTPFLTFGTIILLIFTYKEQSKQVKIQQRQLEYNAYEQNIFECVEKIELLMKTPFPIDYLEPVFNEISGLNKLHKNKKYYFKYNNSEAILLEGSDLFSCLHFLNKVVTTTTLKKAILGSRILYNSTPYISIYSDFKRFYEQLVKLIFELKLINYPNRPLHYHLDKYFYYYKLGYELGFIPLTNFKKVRHLVLVPYEGKYLKAYNHNIDDIKKGLLEDFNNSYEDKNFSINPKDYKKIEIIEPENADDENKYNRFEYENDTFEKTKLGDIDFWIKYPK